MYVIIDAKKYEATEGESVLSVAKRNNIEIPTLCYDERFEPKTSCFLCVVEDKNTEKLVPSCSTFVSDGMEFETKNKIVKDARKTTLELLLSEHDASCFSPCKTSCPSNIDARDYVLYTSKKEEYRGFRIIRKKNPLVGTLGRVCPAFCEDSCNRGEVDETVAIRLLKKQIADVTYDNYYDQLLKDEKILQSELKAKQNKIYNIAIVGGGPAGISSAYYMALNGHSVTIYDENPKLGGMLRYSIPAYRLPREELDREIDAILALGISVKNQKLSADEVKTLSEKNDFVVLATGTWEDTKIVNVGDFNNMEIESALSYLKRMSKGEKTASGKYGEVLIIGGGNTAFDSARTALRRGAKKVTIAYRRTIAAMPAEKIEIEEAIEEGIKIIELVSPKNIFSKENKNFKMLLSFMKETEEKDKSGRNKIVETAKQDTIKFDKLIYAAGQHANRTFIDAINQIKNNNILLAGDVKTGASTVIESVASGRKVAEYIISVLHEAPMDVPKDEMSFYSSRRSEVLVERKLPEKTPQVKPHYIEAKKRIKGDVVYEMPYKEGDAQNEAHRCLNCGCTSLDNCDLRLYSQEHDVNPDLFKLDLPHKPVRTVDVDFSPYLLHDSSKCIKCGQCIDVCSKVSGQNVLAFIDRGYDTVVSSTPDDQILDCSSCGACLDVCPTGAFSEKISKFSYIETEIKETSCMGCALSCKLYLRYSRDKELLYVRGEKGEVCKYVRWEDTRISADKKTLELLSKYPERIIKAFDIKKYDTVFAYKDCPKGDNPALFYKIENFRNTGRVFHIDNLKQMQGIEFDNAFIIVNTLENIGKELAEILDTHKNIKILALYTNLDKAFDLKT